MGDIIQKHAQSNGFSVVRSYCGHGIHRCVLTYAVISRVNVEPVALMVLILVVILQHS